MAVTVMRMKTKSRLFFVAAVALYLCCAPGCGCGRRTEKSDVSDLRISRYRLNVDDAHRVARVMAEVENTGKREVPEAVILATLRGPGEDPYKAGRAVVKDIPAGQCRSFSLSIEARGAERDVDFAILAPDDPRAAEPVAPEAGKLSGERKPATNPKR